MIIKWSLFVLRHKNWIILVQWFLRRFLNLSMSCSYFVIISSWKWSWTLTWIPIAQGCFVPRLVETGPMALEKKIFIISPWKSVAPFFWELSNPHYSKLFCVKFRWNWSSASWEEPLWISSMYFSYFVIISPWKRALPFIWINLNWVFYQVST